MEILEEFLMIPPFSLILIFMILLVILREYVFGHALAFMMSFMGS